MNLEMVEKIANAVMYEGYLLYPYTASSVKNQQRWNFGVLYPAGVRRHERNADRSAWRRRLRDPRVGAKVRFLQEASEGTVERQVEVAGPRHARVLVHRRGRGARRGRAVAIVARRGPARAHHRAHPQSDGRRGHVRPRAACSRRTRSSRSEHGEFVSLMDPPPEYRDAAAACRNVGTWPVLAGAEGERDTMLSSPIILYDYPQIAAESPGDLFDSTEIDEILSLRIMTLSDEEKAEIRAGDEQARRILERTESLPPEQFMKLHGALRGLARPKAVSRRRQGHAPAQASRADIFDIALAGKSASIEAVEQDFDGQRPAGRRARRRSGPRSRHAAPTRTSLLLHARGSGAARMSVLVAGIGNIFLGDDAFGSEVARRLLARLLARRMCGSSTSEFAESTSLSRCSTATTP